MYILGYHITMTRMRFAVTGREKVNSITVNPYGISIISGGRVQFLCHGNK
jgi:hypothetical protein